MTAPSAGRAAIDIVADARKFAASLKRQVDAAIRAANLNLQPLSKQIEDGLKDGVDKGAKAFDEIDDKAERAFREVARDADRMFGEVGGAAEAAGEAVGHEFQEGGEEAEDAFREMDRTAGREFTKIAVKAKVASKSVDKSFDNMGKNAEKAFKKLAGTVAARFASIFKAALTVGSVVSLISPLTSGFLLLGKAIVAAGHGLAALGSVGVAFLPSLIGSLALVVGTLKLAGPGLTKALEPIARVFHDVDGNATAVTKTLQNLIGKGVRPLADAFVKVNMPSIVAAMKQIATATNGIVVAVGKWINSTEGQKLIATIANATAEAFKKLAPHVTAAAIALGRLATRAGDRAITGFGDLIGRILDKFTAWADSKSVEDINADLDKLKHGLQKVKEAFDHVREMIEWVVDHQDQIKAVGTTLGVITLIGGAVTGNWPAAIIAGIGLLLAHWDKVVETFKGVKTWWDKVWGDLKNDPVIQSFVASIKKYFDDIKPIIKKWWADFKTEIIPKLEELWQVIHDKLIPAMKDFLNAMREAVDYVEKHFGPRVTQAFKALVIAITGAIQLITAQLNFMTGILTLNGDKIKLAFSQLGEFIGQIFRGIGEMTVASLVAISVAVGGIIGGMVANVWSQFMTLNAHINAGFRAAFQLAAAIVTQGIATIIGWIATLPSRAGAALATLTAVVSAPFISAWNAAKGIVNSGVATVISAIASIPGRVSGVAGQMYSAGVNIIRGFINGLAQSSNIGNVAGAIASALKSSINAVINRINDGIGAIDAVLPGSLPRIPGLAKGGLTQSGGLANLHPSELVLPLEDARAITLLSKALAEADAGLRASGVKTTGEPAPEYEIHVYIGGQELTDIVDVRISERDRGLRSRVQARTGSR